MAYVTWSDLLEIALIVFTIISCFYNKKRYPPASYRYGHLFGSEQASPPGNSSVLLRVYYNVPRDVCQVPLKKSSIKKKAFRKSLLFS